MPFKSKSQAAFMFAKHPEMAKRWAAETPSIKKLPQHVSDKPSGKHRQLAEHLAKQK